MKSIIILSGGCDNVHSGHLNMFKHASRLADEVCVCLNSDAWLTRKKGKPFMDFTERKYVLESIKYIDKVIEMNDDDGTACDGILKAVAFYKNKYSNEELELFFGNGGDRKKDNTPEIALCNELGIGLLWEIGGGKTNSSSDLLESWFRFRLQQALEKGELEIQWEEIADESQTIIP